MRQILRISIRAAALDGLIIFSINYARSGNPLDTFFICLMSAALFWALMEY